MKQYYLRQSNSDRLLLIFAGWATDERLFSSFKYYERCDVCVVSNYVDYDFDLELLERYKSIRVFAWSLGVFMAEVLLHHTSLPIEKVVALNGTLMPVDDEKGIPKAIYEGTSKNLTDASLFKFFRRMCGATTNKDLLLGFRSDLPLVTLKQSLDFVEDLSLKKKFDAKDTIFNSVVLGTKDGIFPMVNMMHGWEGFTNLQFIDAPHFDSDLIQQLMYGACC